MRVVPLIKLLERAGMKNLICEKAPFPLLNEVLFTAVRVPAAP